MTATDATFTESDLRLIEADFKTLAELCSGREVDAGEIERLIDAGRMPQPAYTLPDGQRMFPDDYLELYDEAGGPDRLRDYFLEQFEAAARAAGLEFNAEWNLESEWTDYLDGTYWICLRNARPEVMIDKERQIRTISELVRSPQPQSKDWRQQLRAAVGALDAIERPFTDFDRARWDYTSRERYITSIKQRYPEAFDTSTA
jgi:Zn-finger nucleic acid-binding protein